MSPTSYRTAPPRVKFIKDLRRQIPNRSLVGLGRFELPTSRLSGVRSNQLSYRPMSFLRVLSQKRATLPKSAVRFNGGRAQGRVASVAIKTVACDLLFDLIMKDR
jgi:hypothetical protein